MFTNKIKLGAASVLVAGLSPLMMAGSAFGDSANNYGPFPVTVKGYEGTATNSVSYSGQIARHVLHDSLKKLASKGDGGHHHLLKQVFSNCHAKHAALFALNKTPSSLPFPHNP